MPPYTTPYVRIPYAGSSNSRLADLIRQAGVDQANARREQGNLSGLLWANVGNNINNTVGQILQAKRDAPINQMNKLRVGEATADIEGDKAARGLQAGDAPLKPGDAGPERANPFLNAEGQWDIPAMSQALTQSGKRMSEKMMSGLENINKLHAEDRKDREARSARAQSILAYYAGVGVEAIDNGEEPVGVVSLIRRALDANETFPKSQIAQVVGQLGADPSRIRGTLLAMRDMGEKKEDYTLVEGAQRRSGTGRLIAENPKEQTRRPDFTIGGNRYSGDTNELLVQGPKEDETFRVFVNGPGGKKIEKLVTKDELMKGIESWRDQSGGSASDRYVWAMQPDGKVGFMTPDEIRKTGAQPPPTAEMRNKADARKLVASSIGATQNLSEKILTKIGPKQRAEAMKRGVDAVLGNDPEFTTYQDARTAMAGNLAVAQQGSRPSDADIKTLWLPLVPDAFRDTADSSKMKWELIRTMSNVPPSEGGTQGPVKPRELPPGASVTRD